MGSDCMVGTPCPREGVGHGHAGADTAGAGLPAGHHPRQVDGLVQAGPRGHPPGKERSLNTEQKENTGKIMQDFDFKKKS